MKNYDNNWEKIVSFTVVLFFLNVKKREFFFTYMELWGKWNKIYQMPDKKFNLSELWYLIF